MTSSNVFLFSNGTQLPFLLIIYHLMSYSHSGSYNKEKGKETGSADARKLGERRKRR